MKIHIPTLALTVGGAVSALFCLGLLIASQKHQYWIQYDTTETGSVTVTVGFFSITSAYTAVVSAKVGLYDTYYTANTDFVNSLIPDQNSAATVDSATTGYFEEEYVKACRGLAIVACISSFGAAVCGVLSIFLPGLAAKILKIAAISSAGFTVFIITATLIVVRTQFKDGMDFKDSAFMCITADILAAAATACFVVMFVLGLKSGQTAPMETKTDENKRTGESQSIETKGDVKA